MEKIKKTLDSGKVRELNAGEMDRLDAGTEKIRAILSPGSQDADLIRGLSLDYCIRLKSRYWARRIQNGEPEVLKLMKNWVFPDDVKKKLIKGTEERLKLENQKLSEDELYKSDACTEKMEQG